MIFKEYIFWLYKILSFQKIEYFIQKISLHWGVSMAKDVKNCKLYLLLYNVKCALELN